MENHHKDLAKYRLEKASDNLRIARQHFQLGNYGDAIGKAYYAVLTAMRALLALHHKDSKRHEGVIILFNEFFIRTKIFPKEFNKIIKTLKVFREDADYGDFVEFSRQTAEVEINNAERFIKLSEKVFLQLITDNNKI
ncbi:MAG: HEPN domain-containing protein [Ignavibacteriae bacterium]|nr:HEPN domain-containing protein [Ignavibacteriota bacterium]